MLGKILIKAVNIVCGWTSLTLHGYNVKLEEMERDYYGGNKFDFKIRINVELYLTGLMLLGNGRGSDVETVNLKIINCEQITG